MLSKEEKYLRFEQEYLTPKNWPSLYWKHFPNLKEYCNNAFWRVSLDLGIEHYIPGLGKNAFYKEAVYNVAGVPSAVTSSALGLKIGSSNNTYTATHAEYAVLRAAGKVGYLAVVVNADPTKVTTAGALQFDSGVANYLVDSTLRWMPLSNEKLQINNQTEIYSKEFVASSVAGGAARAAGGQFGASLANKGYEAFFGKAVLVDPSAISRICKEGKKGALSFVSALTYEVGAKFAWNFFTSILQVPISRIFGTFAEDGVDYYLTELGKNSTDADNEL